MNPERRGALSKAGLLLIALISGGAFAGPVSPSGSVERLFQQIAIYADTNDLALARAVVSGISTGQPPTVGGITAVAECFRRARLHTEGVLAMRLLAPFCTNGTMPIVKREEARALARTGALGAAQDLLESVAAMPANGAYPPNEARNEAIRLKALGKILQSSAIVEAVGLRDSLAACAKNPATGPAAAVRLLQSVDAQVSLLPGGVGIEASDVVRQDAAAWPQAAGFQAALEAAAVKAAAALPEGDIRRVCDYWRLYRGTSAAAKTVESFADRLLDGGHPELAMACYGALLRMQRTPAILAKSANASALASARGTLGTWTQTLTSAERDTAVTAGGERVTVGQFVTRLAPTPPASAPSACPDSLRLTAGWKTPVFPGEGLRLNAGGHVASRTQFARPAVIPAASGRDVLINTGLSLRRYAAETGSNVWTLVFAPQVDDELRERNAPVALPRMPWPAFGVAAVGDWVVCRHAERITNVQLAEGYGLTAADGRTGAVRWNSRNISELADLHVASEPCVAAGIVYVLCRGSSSGDTVIRAMAIEADSGTVLWNRILVMGIDMRGEHSDYSARYGYELPRPLVTSRGICFATHMGRVFMLDALTGAVVWMRGYVRMPDDGAMPAGRINPLLAADGAILTAPYDSARLMALEPATGKFLWDQPASADPFMAGLWRDQLVAFGRGVRLRDIRSGVTLAAEPMAWKPSLPMGFVSGDRLWIADETETRLFDLVSLKQKETLAVGERLVPTAGMAVACAPNVVTAYRPGGTAAGAVAAPAHTIRIRNAPSGPPRKEARGPDGDVVVRHLWSVDSPGSVSIPDDDRGLVLVYGLFNARLLDADSFGGTCWEYQAPSVIGNVYWTAGTVVLLADEALIGLDLATGVERWRLAVSKDQSVVFPWQGDLLVSGCSNATEVLRINPSDGSARWHCAMPSNRVVSAIGETVGRLHVVVRPQGDPSGGWGVWELDPAGKLGRLLCSNWAVRSNKQAFWELGTDRVYTAGDGYRCWDFSLKKELWKGPYTIPGSWVTDLRIVETTPDGRPWWLLRDYSGGRNSVLDPLSGEVLYTGNGTTWNSSVLEFSWDGRHSVSRVDLAHGKPAAKAWTAKMGDWYQSLHPVETGAGFWIVGFGRPPPEPAPSEAAAWFFDINPVNGEFKRIQVLPPVRSTTHTGYWRYANRRLFCASQQALHCLEVMLAAGTEGWFAGRRKQAAAIASPAERARALRTVNLSEQIQRVAETTWLAGAGPLALDQPRHWVPAGGGGEPAARDWAGTADLSCVVTAAVTAASTLRLTFDVRDDVWVPVEGGKGDAVMIGRHVTFGLDAGFQPALGLSSELAKAYYPVRAAVTAVGRGLLRYTLELPPEWCNRYASNASNTVYNLDLAVRDDDGRGVKGAVEWGRCTGGGTLRFRR